MKLKLWLNTNENGKSKEQIKKQILKNCLSWEHFKAQYKSKDMDLIYGLGSYYKDQYHNYKSIILDIVRGDF